MSTSGIFKQPRKQAHCIEHKDNFYSYINLAKKNGQQDVKRLLCPECMFKKNEDGDTYVDQTDSIPISLVLRRPDEMIDKIKSDDNSKYLKILFKMCDDNLETQFSQHIQTFQLLEQKICKIKEELIQRLKEFQEIQINFKKYKAEFLKGSNFESLKESILILQNYQDKTDSKEYLEVFEKIRRIVDDLILEDGNTIPGSSSKFYYNHSILRIELQSPIIDELQTQVQESLDDYKNFLDGLYDKTNCTLQLPKFNLLSDDQFHKIASYLQAKTRKLITKMDQVYVGSRDELKGTSFWKKINGKKNLLMVFRSANEGKDKTIYGGYSPCVWQQNLNSYVPDDTVTSFLFSQTHSQIYPLKEDQKNYAIYCEQGSGPRFGQGHDILVIADFKGGSSNLGYSYQWDDYKNENSENLFGGKQPSIDECEIYELTFK